MSIADCQTCRDFIEDAALGIRRHLEAMARLAQAVQGDPGPEISALEDLVRVCSLNRENAVARYETHLAEHTAKTMAAGSGLPS
jgi:hypothetical protein